MPITPDEAMIPTDMPTLDKASVIPVGVCAYGPYQSEDSSSFGARFSGSLELHP
ncbi:MAG: hypothetical protein ACREBG_22480 [Pyrinomonadaceae bacterium]